LVHCFNIMTAFYMFRLLYLTFFKEFRVRQNKSHLHESPTCYVSLIVWVLATWGLWFTDKQLAERISGSIIY
jgi:NADH:ubiquinone oxidoreductase subunit 5 (subunit L)/multisubunit Na+/H+ antiporter MnhA subunit